MIAARRPAPLTLEEARAITWHRVAVAAPAAAAAIAVFVLLAPWQLVAPVLPILRTIGFVALIVGVVLGILSAAVIAYGPVADELKFTALTDPRHRSGDGD